MSRIRLYLYQGAGAMMNDRIAKAEKKLRSSFVFSRKAAVRMLEQSERSGAIRMLKEALKDAHPGVRNLAVIVLGNLDAQDAVPQIGPLISDPARRVKRSAVQSLRRIGISTCTDYLISGLEDDAPNIRKLCVEGLAEIGDPKAVMALLKKQIKSDRMLSQTIAKALHRIGCRAVPQLIASVNGNDVALRIAAVQLLGDLKPRSAVEPLIEALDTDEYNVRKSVEKALCEFGNDVFEPLVQKLGHPNSAVRQSTVRVLDRLKWNPVSDTEKAYYLIAVGKWNRALHLRRYASSPLLNALNFDSLVDLKNAVKSISKAGLKEAEEPMRRLLAGKNDRELRLTILVALGELQATASAETIIEYLKPDDPPMNRIALSSLVKIGMPAVDCYVNALLSPDQKVRKSVLKLLKKLKWTPLSDEQLATKHVAALNWSKALSIGDPALLPLISAMKFNNHHSVAAAVDSLGELGNQEAAVPLIDTLRSNVTFVKCKCLNALGRIGGSRALLALIDALNDQNESIKTAAAEAAEQILQSSLQPLIELITTQDPQIKRKSIHAAGRMKEPGVMKFILAALDDPDSNVRKTALQAHKQINPLVKGIIFGNIKLNGCRKAVSNVQFENMKVPFENLELILIDAYSYEMIKVEQFITYALDYIGEKYLKRKVTAYIRGNEKDLQQNLLNNLKNNFKKVVEVQNLAKNKIIKTLGGKGA